MGRRGRSWRSRRAVSDVVATILLLALTVTLFASIFAFVTSFPPPPAQNSNQFQAGLSVVTNASSGAKVVGGINILHLAGPSVAPYSLIYFKSSTHPTGPEFANPYTIAQGGIAAGTVWNLGQTWSFTFAVGQQPILPDNITIYIVSSTQLLFSVVLPGQIISTPPTFVSVGTTPALPTTGTGFTVWAVISGSVGVNSVFINLAGVPGLSAIPQKMSLNATTGLWFLIVHSGQTSSNGTFYGFVNATNGAGQTASSSVPITIANPSGGRQLSVAVFVTSTSQSQGTASQQAQGNQETAVALVTYTGALTTNVTVQFYANATAGNNLTSGKPYAGYAGVSPTVSVVGPSTTTLYSTTLWTIPYNASIVSYKVTALAVASGLGTASGTVAFSPILGVVWHYCFPLACTTSASIYSPPASTCTNATTASDTCPYFSAKVWNNGTVASTFSGFIYVNNTATSTNVEIVTIASTAIAGSSSVVTAPAATPHAFKPTKSTHYRVTVVINVSGIGVVTFSWGFFTAS